MVLYLNFWGNKCRYNQYVLSSTNSVCSLTLVIWSLKVYPCFASFLEQKPSSCQLIHILVRRCCYEAVQLFSRVLHGVLMAGSLVET